MIKIDTFNSPGIRKFAKRVGASTMEEVCSFGTGDSRISFYRFETGQLVADTNVGPLLDDEAEDELAYLWDV